MRFWQLNADQFQREGGGVKNAVKAVFFSFKSSVGYDWNRGRFIQYVLYGADGLTRGLLPSPMLNIWMAVLLILNSALIAWVSARVVPDSPARLTLFCLGWVVLLTNSFVISPVILLILYAKYLWVAFVLAFFLVKSRGMKAVWLAAAAYSDEIGLFAAMIVITLAVMRFVLYHDKDPEPGRSTAPRVLRACLSGFAASLAALFVFYGISAVIFDIGAHGFRFFSHRNALDVSHASAWGAAVKGLFWRAEVLVLGAPSGYGAVRIIIGSVVSGIIAAGAWKRGRYLVFPEAPARKRFDGLVRELLDDENCYFYIFWIALLLLITFVIIPFGSGDYIHYSYPAAAVLAVLVIRALADLRSQRSAGLALLAVLIIHLAMLPRAVLLTSESLSQYLFPDRTVSWEDIKAVKKSVLELRAGRSEFFDAFNNGQEMDSSGTWFYSRIKGFGSATGPYFPIQGTVRVLLWPDKISSISGKYETVNWTNY